MTRYRCTGCGLLFEMSAAEWQAHRLADLPGHTGPARFRNAPTPEPVPVPVDPRRQSIYARVTEHPTVPVDDAGRFTVTIRPHLYGPMVAPRDRDACAWCPLPRVHPAHPLEVTR